MAPKALIGCLKSLGIDWMALTDHNTLANCPAYAAVAEREGVSFTWGVEVQTAEEIDNKRKSTTNTRVKYKQLKKESCTKTTNIKQEHQ